MSDWNLFIWEIRAGNFVGYHFYDTVLLLVGI